MKRVGIVMILIAMIALFFFFRSSDDHGGTKKQSESSNAPKGLEGISQKQKPNENDIIQAKVAEMSLDEKIGQLIIAGLDGTNVTEQTKALVESYHVGGFIFFQPNFETPEQALQLVNDVKQLNVENRIPLFLAVDQEGGRVTRLPGIAQMKTNGEIGAAYDTVFSYRTGQLLASQLHAFGLQVNFAPSLDMNSNPQNPVIGDRAFGGDAKMVSEHGVQMMQGMQEENIITSIKHFPGHGDTQEDSHVALPIIEKTEAELMAMELVPFQAAMDAGADMVMIAHILLPKLETEHPATMSKEVVTDLLREKMHYDGVVITDDMTMGAIANHYGLADASVQAIKAGVDIVLMAHGNENVAETFDALKAAVQSEEITEERIDESVVRILRLKQQYELEDIPIENIDVDILNEEIKELYGTS